MCFEFCQRLRRRHRCACAIMALVVMVSGLTPSVMADDLLNFSDIEGKWTGFGWFVFTAGNKERARCTAVITSEGSPNKGRLDLNCTAGALTIIAKAFDIVLDEARATGKWSIKSFNVAGALSGKITSTGMSVYLQPSGSMNADYGASLTAELQGTCRVALTQKINSPLDLKKLDLNLRRC